MFEQEKKILQETQKWSLLEEKVLRQKSTACWIDSGDANSKYFHAQFKIKANQNTISSIYTAGRTKITDSTTIEQEFVFVFSKLMGDCHEKMPCPNAQIIKDGSCLGREQQLVLIAKVSMEEIIQAVEEMPKDKAPGVDGCPIEFYTKNWGIVKEDLYAVVQHFFSSRVMMKAWNCTTVTLIPKVPSPTQMTDFRPIINGDLTNPFKAKRELRQGDHMSPYLFVLAMEADIISITLLKKTLQNFSDVLGLQANETKSSIYVVRVTQEVKNDILTLLGFDEGTLPFKYLGVPLSTNKLTIQQCLPLVEKITAKLIKSVPFGMQSYWAKIFELPKRVIKMIEVVCRTFIWTGKEEMSRRALVAWEKEMKKLEKQGKFQIKAAYHYFQQQHPRVPWKSLTLHKHIHPRHRFHLWLAVQQRLSIVDRLQKFGIQVLMECSFCSQEEETFDHLLFSCSYSYRFGLDCFIGCTSLEILSHGTKSWSGFVTRQSREIAWLRLCDAPLRWWFTVYGGM
ncbi:uncharacterized protein LOC125868574 [Solanum stenotomum]|uniref:uncharacterized protein LOC125868574 n=1 Tax=Solanum stenotomum TaxID=172797 RepID=UPI0020D0157C|nr:uncharacterized protein LOC125868574 [Solanum stenotomum]